MSTELIVLLFKYTPQFFRVYLQLESVTRASETEWNTDVVLPSVSFAPLILPSQESVKDLEALEICESLSPQMYDIVYM